LIFFFSDKFNFIAKFFSDTRRQILLWFSEFKLNKKKKDESFSSGARFLSPHDRSVHVKYDITPNIFLRVAVIHQSPAQLDFEIFSMFRPCCVRLAGEYTVRLAGRTVYSPASRTQHGRNIENISKSNWAGDWWGNPECGQTPLCEEARNPKRQKAQAPTPQAPIRNRQTRKAANAKVLNRNTNLT